MPYVKQVAEEVCHWLSQCLSEESRLQYKTTLAEPVALNRVHSTFVSGCDTVRGRVKTHSTISRFLDLLLAFRRPGQAKRSSGNQCEDSAGAALRLFRPTSGCGAVVLACNNAQDILTSLTVTVARIEKIERPNRC